MSRLSPSRWYRRSWLLHPALFAVYPIAAHLASNLSEVEPGDALRTTLASLLLCGGLLAVLLAVFSGDGPRAALVTSVLLVLAFSYGHVRLATRDLLLAGEVLGRHRYLVSGFLLVGVGWTWIVWKRKVRPAQLTRIFNIVAVVALAFPLVTLAAAWWPEGVTQARSIAPSAAGDSLRSAEALPDVFYIVLDAYPRQDILEEIYGFDNSAFLESLRQRGFFIAGQSRSNYSLTLLSLASSLNQDYVPALFDASAQPDRQQLPELVRHSLTRARLAEAGYPLVAFETGLAGTEIGDAEVYLAPSQTDERWSAALTPFESSLLETTIGVLALDAGLFSGDAGAEAVDDAYERHRQRVRFGLQTLPDVPEWTGHHFVFLHIMSPHPPFVFDADGSAITPARPYNLDDASDFLRRADPKEYLDGYRRQVPALNDMVLQAIDGILIRSETPPIIILQADHGARSSVDWADLDRSDVREAHAILNAYLVPESWKADLYPSITPVNSFRVVLARLLGEPIERLPDRSYFSGRHDYFGLQDVTERLESDGG